MGMSVWIVETVDRDGRHDFNVFDNEAVADKCAKDRCRSGQKVYQWDMISGVRKEHEKK